MIVHINHIAPRQSEGRPIPPGRKRSGRAGDGLHDVHGRGGHPRSATGAVAARASRLDPLQDQFPRSGDRPPDHRLARQGRCRSPRLPSICARRTPRLPDGQLLQAVQHLVRRRRRQRRRTTSSSDDVQAVSRLSDLGLQPAVLATPRRLGSGVREGIRSGAARAAPRTRIIRRRSRTRSQTSGRCCAISTAKQSAAAGDRRPRNRRRLRRARGGMARSVQGARRAVRHQLLFAPAVHPRRLLADQSRARARRRSRITARMCRACRSTRSTPRSR